MMRLLVLGMCLVLSLCAEASYLKFHPKVTREKYGILLGMERGTYSFIELGGEYQHKKLKLKNAPTVSFNGLFKYNLKYNIAQYQVGSWYRRGRANLTYGLNLNYVTDFNENKFGVTPAIGYKLLGFHLQTGYKFLSKANFTEYNTMYVSIRYYLSQKRKTKFTKEDK